MRRWTNISANSGTPRIFEPATVPNLTKSTCFLTVIYYILHIVDVIVMCSSTSMYTFKLYI